MNQLFSRPDWHISLCGHLDAALATHRIPGAPAFMRGLRALFVCDLHVSARTTRADLEAFAARLAGLAPDLLLLGGDYADEAGHAARAFEALAAARPPLGCFGVLGNNDREAWPDPEALRRVMARAGCELLVNQSARLEVNGGRLWIAGVDDHRLGQPNTHGLYPRRRPEDGYRLLLSHYPRVPDNPPDVVLSGHTHGGQFNLLGVTPFTIGFERLLTHRTVSQVIAGQRAVGGAQLLVSKGVGASRIPLRVGVRPEINMLQFD